MATDSSPSTDEHHVPARGVMTRTIAVTALVIATLMIAAAYASALLGTSGPAPWAPWMFAVGVPGAIVAIMVLGAARGRRGGVGRLIAPMMFVGLALAIGFGLALGLPANEGTTSTLVLGLPLRAAIILYGIGLMPIVVLPVAYALTFETQTLNAADIERVRQAGAEWRSGK
jgi:hypothetical protein